MKLPQRALEKNEIYCACKSISAKCNKINDEYKRNKRVDELILSVEYCRVEKVFGVVRVKINYTTISFKAERRFDFILLEG